MHNLVQKVGYILKVYLMNPDSCSLRYYHSSFHFSYSLEVRLPSDEQSFSVVQVPNVDCKIYGAFLICFDFKDHEAFNAGTDSFIGNWHQVHCSAFLLT